MLSLPGSYAIFNNVYAPSSTATAAKHTRRLQREKNKREKNNKLAIINDGHLAIVDSHFCYVVSLLLLFLLANACNKRSNPSNVDMYSIVCTILVSIMNITLCELAFSLRLASQRSVYSFKCKKSTTAAEQFILKRNYWIWKKKLIFVLSFVQISIVISFNPLKCFSVRFY